MSEWLIGTPLEAGFHLCTQKLVSLSPPLFESDDDSHGAREEAKTNGQQPQKQKQKQKQEQEQGQQLVAVAFGTAFTVLPLDSSPSHRTQFCTTVPGEWEASLSSSGNEKAFDLALWREHEKGSKEREASASTSEATLDGVSILALPSWHQTVPTVSGNIAQLEWSPLIDLERRQHCTYTEGGEVTQTQRCSLLGVVTCEGNLRLYAPPEHSGRGGSEGGIEYQSVYNLRKDEVFLDAFRNAQSLSDKALSPHKKKQKLAVSGKVRSGTKGALNSFRIVHCAFWPSSKSQGDKKQRSSLLFALCGYSMVDGSNSLLLCSLRSESKHQKKKNLFTGELTGTLEDPNACQCMKFVEKGEEKGENYFLACCYQDCTVTLREASAVGSGGLEIRPVLLQVNLPLEGIATCFTAAFDADLRLEIAVGMSEGSVAVYRGVLRGDKRTIAEFKVQEVHNECVSGICITSSTVAVGKDNHILQDSFRGFESGKLCVKYPLMRMGLVCNHQGTKLASVSSVSSRRKKNPSLLNKRKSKMCTLDVCTLDATSARDKTRERTICSCSQDGQMKVSKFA